MRSFVERHCYAHGMVQLLSGCFSARLALRGLPVTCGRLPCSAGCYSAFLWRCVARRCMPLDGTAGGSGAGSLAGLLSLLVREECLRLPPGAGKCCVVVHGHLGVLSVRGGCA